MDDSDQAPESAPVPDALKQLERLGDLHRTGALSDDEFADAKASLLRRACHLRHVSTKGCVVNGYDILPGLPQLLPSAGQ